MSRRVPRRALAFAARTTAAAGVCVVVATGFAPGASAAGSFDDGQWYATAFKLADNHTIADGSGVVVAVLDGPVSTSAPSLAGADVEPAAKSLCLDAKGGSETTLDNAVANHATEMVAMIAGQGGTNVPTGAAPGAKVLTYTIGYDDDSSPSTVTLTCSRPGGGADADSAAAAAIQDAVAKGARIINMSYGGKAAQPATQVAILYAMRKGVVFVAASDDVATDTGTRVTPPGSFNGVVLVNAIDRDVKQLSVSASGPEDGPLVVTSAPGAGVSLGAYDAAGTWDPAAAVTGSSPATAFVTGVLATTLSKYPKATGNQLIQSLARNTGGEEHGIDQRAQDGFGYGVVSLTSMLAHDPSTYPDENPTLRDGALPSTADILAGASTSPTAPESSGSSGPASSGGASTSPAARADSDSGSGGLVIGLVVGLAVLLVVVVLVVVLVLRSRGRRSPPPGAGPPPPVAAGYR